MAFFGFENINKFLNYGADYSNNVLAPAMERNITIEMVLSS